MPLSLNLVISNVYRQNASPSEIITSFQETQCVQHIELLGFSEPYDALPNESASCLLNRSKFGANFFRGQLCICVIQITLCISDKITHI